jgi:copper homeostasis protein
VCHLRRRLPEDHRRSEESVSSGTGSVTVEIVCCSVEDVIAAERAGAHRVELCAALVTGGLTPSLGTLIEIKERSRLPVMAMIRPRPGGFHYSPVECAVMEHDAEQFVAHGADGLVFGALTESGEVDDDACRCLVARAGNRQIVFHRAFDLTPDPFAALDALIDLGVTRVLTSGQQARALDGANLIQRLRDHAAGRIEILPGGGIRADNAREVIAHTGCGQIHLAPMIRRADPTSARGGVDYGGYDATDAVAVAEVVRALREG